MCNSYNVIFAYCTLFVLAANDFVICILLDIVFAKNVLSTINTFILIAMKYLYCILCILTIGALECFALCSFMLFMPQITVYIFLLGFKRYGCPNCSRNYCSKSNLSRHLQKECGKLPQFQCHMCESAFKYKHSLLRHILTVHEAI